jgi:hypothetical protein
MPRKKIEKKEIKADGWLNLYTGMGKTGVDKKTGYSYGTPQIIDRQELTDLYRGDGFTKRVINLPTGEMIRKWWILHGDTDGGIIKYLDKIRARQRTLKALRWAHLYGGSIAVMRIIDGGNLDMPLNESNIKRIEEIKVYDRHRITWNTADIYDDENSPKYGTIQYYMINPVDSLSSQPYRVHESRCLIFDGEEIDDDSRQANNGWGDSIIQGVYSQLCDLSAVYHASKNIVDDFIQTILKVDNLQELLASGQEELIKKRLDIIDLGRHIMNTILLDSKEEYQKEASSISGLPDLLNKHAEIVSAVTEIPLTLLMGQSPSGFNAKDEGSLTKWYDKIAQDQEDELRPQMERLAYLAMLCKEGPSKGRVYPDWSLEFNSLWQLSDLQIVEMRHKQAQSDEIYLRNGVLTPEEVAISRFGGDEYSLDTLISNEDRTSEPDIDLDE